MIKIQLNEQQTREFFGEIKAIHVPVNVEKNVAEGTVDFVYDGTLHDNYRAQFSGYMDYEASLDGIYDTMCEIDSSTAKFYLGQIEIEFVGVPQDTVETHINELSHRLIPVITVI